MRFKSLFAFAALLLVVSAASVSAQTTQANGKVTLRQADGTEVPLQGATVTIYRTDINAKYEVKTNKNGEYVRLGLPLIGTFTFAVSAPNAQPIYKQNVRLNSSPENNFVLGAGDGRVLTLDDVKAAAAAAGASGGATTAQPSAADNAEARKRAEEIAKANAEVEAKNAKATEFNVKVPQINKLIETGFEAYSAKKYDEAVSIYDQGIAIEPTIYVFHKNKAAALRGRGVDRYNAAVRSKDKAGQAAARTDIKTAIESAEQSVLAYRQQKQAGTLPTSSQTPATELEIFSERAEVYRIGTVVGVVDNPEGAAKAVQEYINAETDSTKKAKFEIVLANALRDSGKVDEAIASYRRMLAANPSSVEAMFGLGMALQFVEESKLTQNAPEIMTLMKQVLDKGATLTPDQKQAATDSIASMENLLQQNNKPTDTKTRNTRRKG